MSELNLDDCLRKWRRKYGEEKNGVGHGNVYFSIPIKSRRYLVTIFLRWMKIRGVSREELSRLTFIAKYLKTIFGDAPALDKEKRARGHAAAREEFEDVLCVEVFERKSRIKRKPRPILVPEKPEKSTIQSEKKLPQTTEKRRFGKEADPSIYDKVPDVVNVVDEEFAKLLGVDPNE